MLPPRSLLFPLLAALAACSTAPKPQATKVEIPARSAAPQAEEIPGEKLPITGELSPWKKPARSTSTPACRRLAAEQEAASKNHVSPPEGGISDGFFPVSCLPVPGGAWGLVGTVVDHESPPPISYCTEHCGSEDCGPCRFEAIFRLEPMFIADGGAITRGSPITSPGNHISDAQTATFDLDGDGVEEMLLAGNGGQVFAHKGGTIRAYPGLEALRFDRIVDLDQDGRPDLVLVNPYVGTPDLLQCGRRGGFPLIGLGLEVQVVARSLPNGTFSTDDRIAQKAAKVACPARPARLVARKPDGAFDILKIRENVACARLWGASPPDIEKDLDAGCKWPEEHDECSAMFDARDGLPQSVCAGRSLLLGWARAPVSVTLR